MKESILIVEVNHFDASERKEELEQLGLEPWLYPDIDEAKAHMDRIAPEACLIFASSLEEIAWNRLRAWDIRLSLPWIFIVENWTSRQLAQAYSSGAHEILPEGIPTVELAIRVRHWIELFKRIADGNPLELAYADLRMELKAKRVFRGEELIRLTVKEFELLRFLVKRAEQVCPREIILQEVWGYDFSTGTNVVDVYIRHLRKKIDKGHRHKLIHTVRGTGYVLR
ncbi:winged helix-turn-helix transcriptional regulator [Paenibacillus brevis]|uniref:Winged helix-turn-helix domain-containing protein n=1 Tax=Paenibacillus brevis TaxID=2841508 RepID=A0ABS6FQJ2_9BACL|nr:winged helix-turn-helix transcriptional regulator [Paenibacillus brevis]MBU5672500.1 winged helix-turn-helix domain-containing protein [Paenibacillus brevis]